ncbi:MAG: hypothetical protein M3457_12590 [Chloroflexota bacterium]|nr:hypothetical protein [Chloroflexota bacterium]
MSKNSRLPNRPINQSQSTVGRRAILKAGGGATAAALAGPRLASAQDAPSAASPAVGADGYYPSGVPGVNDAYTKMPEPFKSTDGVPGSGDSVVAMVMIYGAPAAGKDDNQYWQGLEERLGVSWDPIQVPNASYGERATAIIASGDMPDMFYLNFNQTLTPLQSFVQEGAFLDLTPYVTGDALQQYPNLATFPDFMWEATKTDGKIYGVPCPGGRSGQVPAFRTDWANTLTGGLPTNADEAREQWIGMATNDPDGNGQADTWAMGRYSSDWDMGIVYPMFRVPNNWRVNDDGTMVNRIETDEYRMAVEFMVELYNAGAYHPDSAAMNFEQALQLFQSGRTGIHVDGGAIYGQGGFLETIRQYAPEAEVQRLIPFGHDGGEGVTYNLPGLFGFTAIPLKHEGNDEKIQELLRIFNWLSAPFGSEEWLYKSFGTEGVHFEYNENGFPVRLDLLDQEEGSLTAYIGGSLGVNWNAEEPEIGPLLTDEAKAIYEIGIDNPVQNLFSPTAIQEGGTLSQLVADTLSNIITGRDDISALDTMVSDWQSRGGDTIRAEYEEAYAANQG